MAYTTIDDPEAYFQTVLYAGNNSTQSITLGGDTDLQPDFVWIKARSDAGEHTLYDSVRGATKRLDSADAGAEDTVTNGVTAFNSDGFSLGAGGNENSATTIVAWCWKESATAGFDINIHTGTGSSADVSHNLSAVPETIFTKRRNDTQDWFVYTTTTGSGKALFLDTTSAISTQANAYDATPTSSVINYGNDNAVNGSDDTYVAYLWRSVQGYSKFGSYKGNADNDGAFVYVGFRPAFVLLKNSTGANGWEMRDNKRPGYNYNTGTLAPSSSDAETTGEGIDILSNGFKLRASGNGQNGDNTYIYMAFAEAPFVNSNGVPANAR